MTLDNLPEPVMAYLAAEEAKHARALSRCFAEDGTFMMKVRITTDARRSSDRCAAAGWCRWCRG